MAKKETMYDIIFGVYELKKGSKGDKEKYRKFITRRFEKKFPNKSWDNISQLEKDIFAYVDVKEDILERYVDESKKKRIIKRIDEKLKTILNERMLAEHNKKVFNEYRTDYYKPEASETPKRKAYDEFCKDLLDINSHVPIPGYDEWVRRNEKATKENGTPLRIYDFIMDFYANVDSQNEVTQAEVDHVVIEILRKVIEEKWGIEINVPKIRECLSFIKNNEYDEFEEIPIEYDASLETEKNISREEWQKYIASNAQYYKYMTMLRKLDFYSKKDN